jgi:hypothetical protein
MKTGPLSAAVWVILSVIFEDHQPGCWNSSTWLEQHMRYIWFWQSAGAEKSPRSPLEKGEDELFALDKL